MACLGIAVSSVGHEAIEQLRWIQALSQHLQGSLGLFHHKALVIGAGLEQHLQKEAALGLLWPPHVQVWEDTIPQAPEKVCAAEDSRLHAESLLSTSQVFKFIVLTSGAQEVHIKRHLAH